MEFSTQYRGYDDPTMIILTNNHEARFLRAYGHTVEEIDQIIVDEKEGATDEERQKARTALYKKLGKRIEGAAKEMEYLILCAPEALREDIEEALSDAMKAAIGDIIPKNLAKLQPDQVIRILQENRQQ